MLLNLWRYVTKFMTFFVLPWIVFILYLFLLQTILESIHDGIILIIENV